MEDNINTTAPETMDDAALDAAWDSEDDFGAPDLQTEQPAADQPKAEPKEETQTEPKADQPEGGPAGEPTPELFTIKNRDETRQVTREELVAMAQKGWDYDTVRQERDQLRQQQAVNGPAVEYLAAVARQNGMDVPTYLQEVQKRELMRTGLSETEAAREMQMRQREEQVRKAQADLDAQKQQEAAARSESQARVEKMRGDIAAFLKAYPGVKPADVPREVWDRVNKGESLVAAYAMHEAAGYRAELDAVKAEVAALTQNQTNAQRSPGSLGGNAGRELDEIDRLWADDD